MEKNLVYSPLIEEDIQDDGWGKSTISYATQYKTKCLQSIRGISRGFGKTLQKAELEDLYSGLIVYLYGTEDYDVSKAVERSSKEGSIVSLEGYVHSCIRYYILRQLNQVDKKQPHTVPESQKDTDGKEVSLFDRIASDTSQERFEDYDYNLKDICELYEPKRYAYGADLFQIWFIRLLTMKYNKNDLFVEIMNVLGISKKDINFLSKLSNTEETMNSFARAITISGVDKAIDILRHYTFSADKLESVITVYN